MKTANHWIRVTGWTACLFGALAMVAVAICFTSAPVAAQTFIEPTPAPDSSSSDDSSSSPADTTSSGVLDNATAPGAPISLSPGADEPGALDGRKWSPFAGVDAASMRGSGGQALDPRPDRLHGGVDGDIGGADCAAQRLCRRCEHGAVVGGESVRDFKPESDSARSGWHCGQDGSVIDRALLSFARFPIATGAQSDSRGSAPIRLLPVQRPGLNFRTAR